ERAGRGGPRRTMIAMPLARLRRSDDDRVVAGVCAGIAERLGVDPTLVRLVFTLLALAGGAGIVLYGAAWLWMSGRALLAIIGLVVAGGGGAPAPPPSPPPPARRALGSRPPPR